MREIKFRAWDKIDKKMRIVTRMTFGLEPTGHPPIIVHLDDGKDPVTRSINDVDLIQYTGFKDKNGKEIYEGDIVKGYVDRIGKKIKIINMVKWDDRVPAFTVHDKSQIKSTSVFMTLIRNIKIIGNIYENPELLK